MARESTAVEISPRIPSISSSNCVEENLLEKVLSSTATAARLQKVVRINEEAISKFIEGGNVTLEKYRRAAFRVPLPLKFDDNAQEINLHCLLALLSFGGAHERELVRLTGMTVEDSVKFGLIGSHLGRERLDATWMKNAHVGTVSEMFKIPVRESVPSTIPGITVDKPGALVAHAQALCSALNSTGEALLSMGYSDMAQFVIHSVRSDPGAEGLVRSLVGAIPAFQDTETIEERTTEQGYQALMLKNSQVLAGELCARMGPSVKHLRFGDADKLTAVADADTITALIAFGILEPCSPVCDTEGEVAERGKGGLAFQATNTAALRAVAVQACHRLARSLGDEVRPHELSLFLRRIGRRAEYKDVPGFIPRESAAV